MELFRLHLEKRRDSMDKAIKNERNTEEVLTGTFCGSGRGFGFVSCPDLEEDIFISARDTAGAFHGDDVQVQIIKNAASGRRSEGRIVRILRRNTREITGVVQKRHHLCTVIPDHPKFGDRIVVRAGKTKGAAAGDRVAVRILDYGTAVRKPEGAIQEIFGNIADPSCDAEAVIRGYQIPVKFPEEVLRQAKSIPQEVTSENLAGRKDLREVLTITIDSEDAKDLDDAVSLHIYDGIYHLGVHIADVSHYVREGSLLDKEALHRGTSVYFTDRVIPMLPVQLSNGICSLAEGKDRLVLSCLMEIDEKGNIISHEITEAVIRVNHRMSYHDVTKLLEGEESFGHRYDDILPMLREMKELSDLLREKRMERGGISFDFQESIVEVDKKGRPVEIRAAVRDVSSRMIEDFMLAANETVAQDYFWQDQPFLYRSHEKPDPDRIHRLFYFLRNYGYYLHGGREDIHPKEFQKILAKIAGSAEESMISRLILRSMKRARYTTTNLGHFGLAAGYYCHFTSPIRRYPDLQIHRIIKENLHGMLDEERMLHYSNILPEVAEQSSLTERRADDAERDVISLKKAEYMSQRIGEIYDGVLSGMSNYGLFVELENTCEGVIRYESMDDYYELDPSGCFVTGVGKGKVYSLGDKVRIRVKSVDLQAKTVYFGIADDKHGGIEHEGTWRKTDRQ